MATPARTISIALALAANQFNAGLTSASRSLHSFSNQSRQDLASVGAQFAGMSAAMTLGLGVVVNAAAGFEAEMSNVAAVSGATGQAFNALREQAIDLGADTVFTAGEVAQAQAELAKAGVSTGAILSGALEGALSLAAASNIDLAMAAEVAAQAINTFNLSGRDVPHVADVLAAAANKSAADVSDMALALKQSGAAAQLAGLTLEETSAALAIFANAGVKGSDAGTSFKTMLQRLSDPSEKAKSTMDALGISFEDANGNMRDLPGIAEELQRGLGRLTTDTDKAAAVTRLFGSDAQRAGFFLSTAGADGVNQWIDAVSDQGYASEVAAKKLDNLKGDVEKLGGAFDSVLIGAGSEATGALREMVQVTTNLVTGVGRLPAPVQSVGVGLLGVGAAATGSVAALGLFIPLVRNVSDALTGLGAVGARAAGALTMSNFIGLGIAAAGAAVPIIFLTNHLESVKNRAEETEAAFAATFKPPATLAEFDNQITAMLDRQAMLWERYQGAAGNNWLNQGSMRVWEALPGGSDTFTETEQQLHALQENLAGVIREATVARSVIENLGNEFGWSEEQVRGFADANGVDLQSAIDEIVLSTDGYSNSLYGAAAQALGIERALRGNLTPAMEAARIEANSAPPAIQELDEAIAATGDSALTAQERLDAYTESLDQMLGIMRGPAAAARDFDEAMWKVHDAAKALNEVKWHGFDEQLPEAYAYQEAMDGLLESYTEELSLARQRHAPQSEMDALYGKMSRTIADMGASGALSETEVAKLNQQVALIPRTTDAHIAVHTADAETAVARLAGAINALPGFRSVTLGAMVQQPTSYRIPGFADGGIVAFADGGHFAQIAPAGAMRLWAEPETGGEAYIPMGAVKRPRSVEILHQVNQAFGNPLGGGVNVGGIAVTVNAPGGDARAIAREVERAVTAPNTIDKITKGIARSQGARAGARA